MASRFRPRGKHSIKPSRPRGPSKVNEPAPLGGEPARLQKVLAAAGIGSRRKCEELITAGRVTVDGRTVTELGTKVDPDEAEVRVDGEPLPRTKRLYYLVNKPTGVVSSNRDPSGRPRVVDLLPSNERLFTVGRLDVSSEGLILVTNDGELANLLAHPRYGVEKVYHAQVVGVPEQEVLDRLRQGVHLAEGFAHAKRISIKSQHKQSALLEMVLDEGRNREVRRLLARVGHKVLRLKRVALGPLRLGDMPPGEFRPLRREEVRALKEAARASHQAGATARPALAVAADGQGGSRLPFESEPQGRIPDGTSPRAAARGPARQAGPTTAKSRPRSRPAAPRPSKPRGQKPRHAKRVIDRRGGSR
jgi:23S rRNA pseudouridine2605 synthase